MYVYYFNQLLQTLYYKSTIKKYTECTIFQRRMNESKNVRNFQKSSIRERTSRMKFSFPEFRRSFFPKILKVALKQYYALRILVSRQNLGSRNLLIKKGNECLSYFHRNAPKWLAFGKQNVSRACTTKEAQITSKGKHTLSVQYWTICMRAIIINAQIAMKVHSVTAMFTFTRYFSFLYNDWHSVCRWQSFPLLFQLRF